MGPFLERRHGLAWIAGPPILLAAVLAMPCLTLGYFWDDFVFLSRVQAGPIAALGPEAGAFYRPIPRAIYFWPLAGLGSSGAWLAHAMNLLLAAVAIYLLVDLARELEGDRAGMIAGFLLAGLATLPGLIGWASGSQDLLAMVFGLWALRLRHAGRLWLSGVALAAALLSKETAVCFLPALLLWDLVAGRRPARLGAGLLVFGGFTLGWALLHPGIHQLAARGFVREPRAYVGFANLAVTEFHARRYLLALANVPTVTSPVAWTTGRAAMLATAVVLALGGLWIIQEPETRRRLGLPRIAILSASIALPALALPALLIQRFAGYFVCLPALGIALFLGALLARVPPAVTMAAVAAYVGLGFWSRAADTPDADALTERSFIDASRATRAVERGFRALRPTFPRESQVLVSVASSGLLGIDGTLHDGQALRTFYRDPTIRTLRPERRLAHPRAEFLYRITDARDVVEIDPDRGTARSSGAKPDDEEVRAVTRTYARGLAATGETGRSVRILSRLAATEDPSSRSYDLRIAAMGLLADGDVAGAKQLLGEAPALPPDVRLYGLSKVMAEPTARASLDSCAYVAFGISARDPDALRELMELFYGSLFVPQAVHFARRLLEVAPGDSESAAIVKELAR